MAICEATRPGSRTAARPTKQTPSAKASEASAATCSDRRVFPVPPGPVSVTSRCSASSRPAAATSPSRPTNDVSWVGRLTRRPSSERIGGNSVRSPSATSWNRCCGSRRSLRRCGPRSRKAMSPSASPWTSARVASDTRTCPPCATPAIRAARLMSMPTSEPPAARASPEWIPIRTRIAGIRGPGFGFDRALGGNGRGQGAAGGVEHHEEGVALRALLVAAARGERRPEERAVPLAHVGVGAGADLLLETGRALDVGEQEGQGRVGEVERVHRRLDARRQRDGCHTWPGDRSPMSAPGPAHFAPGCQRPPPACRSRCVQWHQCRPRPWSCRR